MALSALASTIGRNDDLFGPSDASNAPNLDGLVELVCSPSPKIMLEQILAGTPNWDALRCWIAADTIAELQVLLDKVCASTSDYIQLLGLCMISATARSISSQHSSWGHIADNVRPRELTNQSVNAATSRWLQRTRAFLQQSWSPESSATGGHLRLQVHRRDWSGQNPTGPGDSDLLLTSPPYADAIDYTLAQRLSLYILGYDDDGIAALVATEIGARRKRFKKSASRTQWSEQLCSALTEQLTWLKPGGTVCLVLPHKDSGRSVGEDDLKIALAHLGWKLFFERDRSIHQSHTRQSWTSIKRETILAFAAP